MKVMSYKELRLVKGIPHSRQWLAKLVKAGKFPAPMKIGERANGYIEAEVDAWMDARAKARKAA
jgi:prophage regulatory protein